MSGEKHNCTGNLTLNYHNTQISFQQNPAIYFPRQFTLSLSITISHVLFSLQPPTPLCTLSKRPCLFLHCENRSHEGKPQLPTTKSKCLPGSVPTYSAFTQLQWECSCSYILRANLIICARIPSRQLCKDLAPIIIPALSYIINFFHVYSVLSSVMQACYNNCPLKKCIREGKREEREEGRISHPFQPLPCFTTAL